MKLTQLIETKERPYIVVHAKKGKHETHAKSSYEAVKNAAEHWGLKSTAGIDAHLADVEHVAEETITEGPCDVAKPEEIEKMSGEEYDKYAQWKKDCEAEERTTPLSTKRLESEVTEKGPGFHKGAVARAAAKPKSGNAYTNFASNIKKIVTRNYNPIGKSAMFNSKSNDGKRLESFDDYHGDMSQEEYDQEVDNSQMEYAVWVGGTEVNDKWLTYDEAIALYDKYKAQGYDDIKLDARLKEGSFWGRDDMVKKMKDGEKASGMKKFVKIDDKGNHHGATTSDPEQWKELIAKGYKEDTGYYEGAKPDFLDLDKDGDKKEPMKKAGKTKKEVCAKEAYNPETGRDPNVDTTEWDELIAKAKKKQKEKEYANSEAGKRDPAYRHYHQYKTQEKESIKHESLASSLIASRQEKRESVKAVKEDEEAIVARDEFLKVMDMKGKTPGPGKQIDTIKKIVADKQNMQVAFDDGKMRVDLYTASAVSQVYDAVKPETQVKIDNMLRTKAGMLKMSDFAFSKLKEGLKEGKQLDEILPLVGLALGAVGRAVAGGVAKAAGSVAKAAVAKPVSTALKTRAVANTMKDKDKTVTQKAAGVAKITGVTEEELEELQAPYTGADAVIDKMGKKHKPGSPKAQMIINMKKKPVGAAKKTIVAKPLQNKTANTSGVKPAQSTVKPVGVGRGKGAGSKATQIQPGGGSAAGKAADDSATKMKQGKRGAMIGKVKSGVKKVGSFAKNIAMKGMDRSGIGNPLAASKQYADNMIEDAIKKAEELEEYPGPHKVVMPKINVNNIKKLPKFKVSGPHGQKPGSHHPPAKTPGFKASVKF